MKVKIINKLGMIEEIKISPDMWTWLHHDNEISFDKDKKDFFDRFNLESTIFNINCLSKLDGVILTDMQIANLIKLQGGLD
jgi:hypothetical protein